MKTLLPALALATLLAGAVAGSRAQQAPAEPAAGTGGPGAEDSTPEAAPGEITMNLDPQASRITFTLGATLHTVEGSFQVVEGEVRFDPATGEASGRIVVDATSGDTGNDKRDRDMHAKVLESEQFPRFVFIPERLEGSFEPSGRSQVVLHGSLEIHGDSHPVAIPAEVGSEGDRLEADGHFEVPYVEWGMKDPSKFILRVEKSVEVEVHAVGRLSPGGKPGA